MPVILRGERFARSARRRSVIGPRIYDRTTVNNFSTLTGTTVLSGGQLAAGSATATTGSTGDDLAYHGTFVGTNDMAVEADLVFSSTWTAGGDYVGLIARMDANVSNYVRWAMDPNGTMSLHESVPGFINLLTTYTAGTSPFAASSTVRLRLVVAGRYVEGSIGGAVVAQAVTTHVSGTQMGAVFYVAGNRNRVKLTNFAAFQLT